MLGLGEEWVLGAKTTCYVNLLSVSGYGMGSCIFRSRREKKVMDREWGTHD